jgi:hypothetical protein
LSEVVRFAASPAEFVQQTRAMLAQMRAPGFRDRCIDIARDKTWDARVAAASRLMLSALARKRAQPTMPQEPASSLPPLKP